MTISVNIKLFLLCVSKQRDVVIHLGEFFEITNILVIFIIFLFRMTKDFEQKKKIILLSLTKKSVFTFSKLTIETLEQGVKYVQS